MTEEKANYEQPKEEQGQEKTSCVKRVIGAGMAGVAVGAVSGALVGATVLASRALTGQLKG